VRGPTSFPRSARILRRAEYERIYATGVKYVAAGFVLYTLSAPGEGARLGMAVSRKVGSAVVRNRVKRRIREAYRLRRPCMAEDVWVVVVARPACAQWNGHACTEALDHLFRRGQVLSG
jgi:ribonuclease P protein component